MTRLEDGAAVETLISGVPASANDQADHNLLTMPRPNDAGGADVIPETWPGGATGTADGHQHAAAAAAPPRRFGDYELLGEIARGGMGVVYKARQVKANRIVALKMILKGDLAANDDVQRFYVEARAAANLHHPNIVPVFDVGEQDGQHYFAMGYIEGQSLADRVKQGPLPPREAVRVIKAVSEAIVYAHHHGTVHRDLKPSNVLIDAAGQPIITDFGLAKNRKDDSGLTATGQVLGTPSFMPPEQAQGEIAKVGPLADVYSLGATLYHLLTGRPPFLAASLVDTLYQVLHQDPASPRQINAKIDEDLETICLKCLQKEQTKRYASADALVADLAHWLNGEPIVARPVGRVERFWRWSRRNPALAGWSAAAVLFLLIGTVVSTVFGLLANARARVADAEKVRADENTAKAVREGDRANAEREAAEGEREIAARQLYVNQIRSAHREWNLQNTKGALLQLAATQRRFRNWEYQYLHHVFHRHQAAFQKTGVVLALNFSPDGQQIVGAYRTSEKLPMALTREEARSRLTVLLGPVTAWSMAWDGWTGDTELTRAFGTHVDLKPDDPGGQEQYYVQQETGVHERVAAFSPGRGQILTGVITALDIPGLLGQPPTINELKLWDTKTGREMRTLRTPSRVNAVAFSPDGSRIVSAGWDAQLIVYEVSSGTAMRNLTGHSLPINAVAYSPDGSRIASGSDDKSLKLWDAGTGELLLSLTGHAGSIKSLTFSPDGNRLVSGSDDRTMIVWDATTGDLIWTLAGHLGAVTAVAFRPDGGRLASGSGAVGTGELKLWDTSTGQPMVTLQGHTDYVNAVAFSPDGRQVVSSSVDQSIKLWNARLADVPLTLNGRSWGVSPDGRWILFSDNRLVGALQLFDLIAGSMVNLENGGSAVQDAAFSADGRQIISASETSLTLWDAETGRKLRSFQGDSEGGLVGARTVQFSPDGRRIVGGGIDNTLRVWEAATGASLLTLDIGQVSTFARFDPDGNRIFAGSIVLDVSTGKRLKSQEGTWHALSADCSRFASRRGETVAIGDVASGDVLLTLLGHTDFVNSVSFSPDGSRIVTGSSDKTVKLWDAATGEELLTLRGHADALNFVTFSPDGRRISSASDDGSFKLWDASGAGLSNP
ncbi:MAG: protein kinase domain-containing protein [Planctomycetales bacterium]